MNKKVIFYPGSHEAALVVPLPKPATDYIPRWYKNLKMFYENNPVPKDGRTVMTAKACVPYFDAMTAGWIQELWTDVWVEHNSFGQVEVNFSRHPQPVDLRPPVSGVPASLGTGDQEYTWHQPWSPRLPAGYSMLYTHPLNNQELPFRVMSAIIDSDVFWHTENGNVPFHLKEGFTGLIPAGTPLFQMIPIHRATWTRQAEKWSHEKSMGWKTTTRRSFYGAYRKLFHQKKRYL